MDEITYSYIELYFQIGFLFASLIGLWGVGLWFFASAKLDNVTAVRNSHGHIFTCTPDECRNMLEYFACYIFVTFLLTLFVWPGVLFLLIWNPKYRIPIELVPPPQS